MLGKFQIILLTALPTGAALLYLLWMYRRKRAPPTPPAIDSIPSSKTPTIEVSDADDQISDVVESVEKKQVGVCGNWKNMVGDELEEACNSISASWVMQNSSDCFEEQFQIASKLGCMMLGEPKNGMAGVRLSSSDADATSGVDTASNRTVDSFDMTLSYSGQRGSTSVSSSKDADLMDDNDDVRVQTPTHDTAMMSRLLDGMMNDGITSIDDVGNWGNCVVDDVIEDEVMNTKENVPLIMDSCGNARKDSMGSASDANSSDSRDRNANQRTPAAAGSGKEKNKVRRGSTSKEKTVVSHMFDFPTHLCGRLIGNRGRNIASIKDKSGAEIFIKAKMYDLDWQVVKLEGSRQQVNKALDMIRHKFPLKRFPEIDYNRCVPDAPVVPAELMRLILPYGVPVEVVVSHVISPNHIFVQQPTHPTFPLLERQTYNMRACYNVDNVPLLPRPIEVGMICAAPLSGDWFRAQVVQAAGDVDEYDLKLIDFGGYVHLPGSVLRQIRSDFMTVPFQAIECYMANVIPPTDDDEFPENAKSVMEELVGGSILQCDVVGIEADGVQYVVLTKVTGSEGHVISRELVSRGVARWLEM